MGSQEKEAGGWSVEIREQYMRISRGNCLILPWGFLNLQNIGYDDIYYFTKYLFLNQKSASISTEQENNTYTLWYETMLILEIQQGYSVPTFFFTVTNMC